MEGGSAARPGSGRAAPALVAGPGGIAPAAAAGCTDGGGIACSGRAATGSGSPFATATTCVSRAGEAMPSDAGGTRIASFDAASLAAGGADEPRIACCASRVVARRAATGS
jgi:hypothetical protein